ncbi:MAG: BMP family ABC transporter substrate-binding protein [Tessaracoccus sp.]
MTISLSKKLIGAAGSAALIFSLSACGEAPEATPTTDPTGGTTSDAAPGDVIEGFKACMVSDEGGFDDKSFNEAGHRGLTAAATELGIETTFTESQSATDYASNLDGLVADGCNLIISVGYLLSAPTVEAALANPDVHFAIIDDWADNTGPDGGSDGETDAPNIKPLVFDTAQAAFLGGYAAASYSESGTVGTFGGMKIPPVTIFMDGFVKGVEHFNAEKGAEVNVVGWDVASQDGLFTEGFAANDTAKVMAQGLLDQGADVLLPVGGPIYQSAAQAIRDTGEGLTLMGVDSDVAISDPSVADLLLVSVQKAIDVAVHEAVVEAAVGNFDVTPFVGTLENEGVTLSSFHDFEDQLDPELQAELEAIAAGIVDGSIDASSVSSP